MLLRVIGWPTRKIVDWVMEDYNGFFPKSTRRWEEIKVVLGQITLALLVITVILVVR